MDITKTIAKNLDAWMVASVSLDTLKKVAARSGVGFGTVRRARNGDGNTTIQNLSAIARAFGRKAEDLMQPMEYEKNSTVTNLRATETVPDLYSPLIHELINVCEKTSDRGVIELIGRAKEIALQYPKAKANHSRS